MAANDIPRPLRQYQMTTEEKALHQRILAAADPASVSRAEKNQILQLPPPEEEDRLCIEKVGLTKAELMHKVMTSPGETLSAAEVDIIVRGVGYDRDVPNSGTNSSWVWNLPPEEHKLARQVRDILANDYDNEVYRRAHNRRTVLEPERTAKRKQDRAAAQRAQIRALSPQWINDMKDAKLSRWGFVIFRTVYAERTDKNWQVFRGKYARTASSQIRTFGRAADIAASQRSVEVCDASLEGASVEVLRARFREMRDKMEIPDGIATDCFLVADEAVINHPVVVENVMYQPKPVGQPDPWHSTLSIRAINPDHDVSRPASHGEITIPLPKVFDWLYYCFLKQSENWETRYKVTTEGAAEMMGPLAPYPAYRSGTEPLPS